MLSGRLCLALTSFKTSAHNGDFAGSPAWGARTRRITHLLTGAAIGAGASFILDGELLLPIIGMIAAMLPDLDVLPSRLYRRAHRSPWSHSIGASAVCCVAWVFVSITVLPGMGFQPAKASFIVASGMVIFISVFVHAVEDAMTRHGCILLFPLSRRRFRGPFAYDDVVANATLSAASVACTLLLVASTP